MKYIEINKNTTLEDLTRQVGRSNIDNVLHINGLSRVPNVGEQYEYIKSTVIETNSDVDTKSKLNILNTLTSNSDVFEKASMLSGDEWKVLSYTKSLPDMIQIPDDVTVSIDAKVLGNHIQVPSNVYQKTMNELKYNGVVSGSSFNTYDNHPSHGIDREYSTNSNEFQWFKLPWGEVMLYSSISDSYVEFPVYPEEISDARSATYTTMPDLLYQYEPWQIYLSSGPRENSYKFHFHRDMWTGDHGDGKANELIRFCQANCYPDYRGSATYTPTVTLYISGQPIINGILTRVDTLWSGPLGKRDNFYLDCELTLSIIEVSKEPLNYTTVMNKPLVG